MLYRTSNFNNLTQRNVTRRIEWSGSRMKQVTSIEMLNPLTQKYVAFYMIWKSWSIEMFLETENP